MLEEAVARQDADPFRWRLPKILENLELERGVDFLFPGGMTPEKETWALLMGVHLAMRQRLAVVKRLIAGESVDQKASGLSAREWRELMEVLGRAP